MPYLDGNLCARSVLVDFTDNLHASPTRVSAGLLVSQEAVATGRIGSAICAKVCRIYFYAAGSSVACMNAGKQTASLRCVHGVGHHTSSGHCMAEPRSRLQSIKAKTTRFERMHTKKLYHPRQCTRCVHARGRHGIAVCANMCILPALDDSNEEVSSILHRYRCDEGLPVQHSNMHQMDAEARSPEHASEQGRSRRHKTYYSHSLYF